MARKTVNVALIGTKFMGKAHSNAYLQAPRFFDMKTKPVMKVIYGTDPEGTQAAADQFGWEEASDKRGSAHQNTDDGLMTASLVRCKSPRPSVQSETTESYRLRSSTGRNQRSGADVRTDRKLKPVVLT